ncbi:MAG: AAA family ATPase [Oscillospiraceae bacterium]|nr:AAA family ATPase [Oscillospiraceae bacterium]
MREYAITHRVYGSDFTNNLPYCFKAFVKADNDMDGVKETAKLILNLYRQLGQAYIKCDGATKNETYSLTLLCDNMEAYIDSKLIESVNDTFGKLQDELNKVAVPVDNKTVPLKNVDLSDIKTASPQTEATQEQAVEEEKEPEKTLDELLEELNILIGLEKVKEDVNSLINLVKIRKIREERGMDSPDMSLHMVFSGNPGTGKTTIARLLAEIYKAMGLLSKGHLTEVDRSGLVGGYVGQTALKVQEVVNKAKGGVLFIDEAYSLTVNRGATDYGFEAVDTLLKFMEDNRDDLIVIVAGYPKPMEEFLNSNPGLKSRFNKYLYFDDYTPEELIGILKLQAKKADLVLSEEAEKFATEFFTKRCENRPENYANARDVRNFFEKALINQANRLAVLDKIEDSQLTTLEVEDFNTIIL